MTPAAWSIGLPPLPAGRPEGCPATAAAAGRRRAPGGTRLAAVRLLAFALLASAVGGGWAAGVPAAAAAAAPALRLGGLGPASLGLRAAGRGRAGAILGALCVREGQSGCERGAEGAEGGLLRLRGGAKSKNHTNHNQIKKAHRNGIKRVKTHRHETTKDIDIKTWRNMHYSRKGSMKIHRRNLLQKRTAQRLADKGKAAGAADAMEEGEAAL